MNKPSKDNIIGESFLTELYQRTKTLSFNSDGGNFYISIDLKGATTSFSRNLEDVLIENADKFSIRVRGEEYFVELLNKKNFSDLYEVLSS